MRRMCIRVLGLFLISATCIYAYAGALEFSYAAADSAAPATGTELKPYIGAVEQAQQGMTLWQLIKTGGFIMVILSGLSIAAIASIT